MIASKSLVSNDVYTDVMSFTGFLAVRSRRFRNVVADFVDRSERMQLSAELATPEGWERFRLTTIQAIESKGSHLTRVEREVLSDPAPFRKMVNRGTVVAATSIALPRSAPATRYSSPAFSQGVRVGS